MLILVQTFERIVTAHTGSIKELAAKAAAGGAVEKGGLCKGTCVFPLPYCTGEACSLWFVLVPSWQVCLFQHWIFPML